MRNHIQQEEDSNMEACSACAQYNGHSVEEAENCNDGSVGCPECPFMFRPGITLIKAPKLKIKENYLKVVKTYPPDSDGFKEVVQPLIVLFEGEREDCYRFMLKQKNLYTLELIYSNGRLASYVL